LKTFFTIIFLSWTLQLSAEEIIEIDDGQLEKYWVIEEEKMDAHAPIEFITLFRNAMSREGGTLYEYNFLVDADGYPKEFQFIKASPKEGNEDKELLKKFVLFQRYKPSKINSSKNKVKVNVQKRIWNPEK